MAILDQFGRPAAAKPLGGPKAFWEMIGGSGYGQHGASVDKQTTRDWLPFAGSPDDDIVFNRQFLAERSRDIIMSNPIAAGAINVYSTDVISDGITPAPNIDAEFLGLSEDQADKLQKLAKREFLLWANSPECDFDRRCNFWTLQDLVLKTMLMGGDAPVLLPFKPRSNSIYDLRVRLLESDRVQTPWDWDWLKNIIGGVELDEDGEVIAYHVRQVHPLARFMTYDEMRKFMEWVRVPAYNAKTGRPNALLVMEPERPSQRRGVPFLAKILESLKNLDRYQDATLINAVFHSYFSMFIESPFPNEFMFDRYSEQVRDWITGGNQYEVGLGEGTVTFLKPGDQIKFADPKAPSNNYEHFINANVKFIGAALQIPKSVLLHEFNNSYSASRAELLYWHKRVMTVRNLINAQFNQPVYETWFAEAVAKGIIPAKGFFENPRIRAAYTACDWHGVSQGSLDPQKDAAAYKDYMILGVTTKQRICAEVNGSDWRENTIQQGREAKLAEAQGLPYVVIETPIAVTKRVEDISQDDSGSGDKDPQKKAEKKAG